MPFFELLNGLAPPAERMRWEASLVRHVPQGPGRQGARLAGQPPTEVTTEVTT